MDVETRHDFVVGREFYQAGELEKARPHLEAVLVNHDGYADVHNMLGVIHYQSGHPGTARRHFERALEINPRYTEAALNLAVCYNELGRYDEAKTVYAKAAGGYAADAGSLEWLDSFVRGKIANMHGELGTAYVAVGLAGNAIDEFRKALHLCPTFVDIRTKLGTTLRDIGDVDGALDELIAVREASPNYLPGRVQLGITLWTVGRTEEARAEWAHVLARDPENRSCTVYLSMTEDDEA